MVSAQLSSSILSNGIANLIPSQQPSGIGHHGVETWSQRPSYNTYKSPYGPQSVLLLDMSPIGLTSPVCFG